MLLNPKADKFQFSEINDKTILIQFCCFEGNLDTPIMSVDKGTMTIVGMLTMGKWDIGIDFRAGEHGNRKGDVCYSRG